MIRKLWCIFMAVSLLIGLSACGAADGNNDTAFDQNGPLNVRNDGGMNDRYQTVQHGFNSRLIGVDPVGHRNLNKHWNQNGSQGRQNLNKNEDPNISADYTQLSSKEFPHTKAIVVKESKYSFTPVSAEQVAQIQKKIEKQLKAKFGKLTPKLKQQARTQAQQQIKIQQNNQQQGQAQQQQQTRQEQKPPKAQTQQPGPADNQAGQQGQTQQPAQQQPQQPAQQEPAPQDQGQTGDLEQMAAQVVQLTNQERAKEGLPALKADTQLSSVAKKKSQDMQANNYFSHTSPTYGSPFDMMRDFGVTYKTAGENIAQGQRTPEEVVQAWMNSEGHRKNIMSKDFTHIGVGHEAQGNHWTQMFIGK